MLYKVPRSPRINELSKQGFSSIAFLPATTNLGCSQKHHHTVPSISSKRHFGSLLKPHPRKSPELSFWTKAQTQHLFVQIRENTSTNLISNPKHPQIYLTHSKSRFPANSPSKFGSSSDGAPENATRHLLIPLPPHRDSLISL